MYPEPKQINQGKKLRRIIWERKRLNRHGYEPTNFNYFSTNPHHTHSHTSSVSFLSHMIPTTQQQFYDDGGILE